MVLAILSVLKSTHVLHVVPVTKQPNRKPEGFSAVMADWMVVPVRQAAKKASVLDVCSGRLRKLARGKIYSTSNTPINQ